AINRKRVRRLMQLMGLEAIYPKPNLSKRLHAIYPRPYLLRGLQIDRPNQVWGIDITYLRMGKGFMCLFNIIDWYSRKVIDYELSSTLEKGFVLKCLKRAFSRCKPEIINSDQGSHFTNADYLELLEREGIKVSTQFAIPAKRVLRARGTTVIREDWLKEVGMPLPETTEQFYEVLKAFKRLKLEKYG